MLISMSCEPSLYENYHSKSKWQSCQPISDLQSLKISFSGFSLSQMEMSRITECNKVPSKQSHALFVKAAALPRRHVSIYWRRSHENMIMPFFVPWGEMCFFLSVQSQVWTDQANWTPCFAHTVQGCLVAIRYRPRYPDQWPRLNPDHCRRRRRRRRMLASQGRRLTETGQKWWSTINAWQRVARGLINVVRSIISTLAHISTICEAKRWHSQGDSTQLVGSVYQIDLG